MNNYHLSYDKNSIVKDIWANIVPFAIIYLVACWIFFFQLGKFPLFNPDEGLFAEPAREILDTGEWTTSLLNYVVRYTKPPLVMWAMAFSYMAFGTNEFAARFFVATCASLVVACLYCFLARYRDKKTALIGTAALLSAPLFVGTARVAITDIPLTFFFSSSMLAFYRSFVERSKFWLWIAYFLMGLAIMTKGPVAIVLPAIILFVYHYLRGNLREAFSFYKSFIGILIVAVISLPWFITEIVVTKGAYFNEFIMRENLQRYTGVVDSHQQGWWYHLAALVIGFFPWSIFLPQSIFSFCLAPFLRSHRESVIKPSSPSKLNLPGYGIFVQASKRQDLAIYAACWLVTILIFFSVSISKLLTYTLPAFPAAAILIALEIASIIELNRLKRLAIPLALLAIIYGASGLIGTQFIQRLQHCPKDLPQIVGGFIAFQCLTTIMALLALRKPLISSAIFSILTLFSTTFFGYKIVTTMSNNWEGALPDFARYAARSSRPIIICELRKPGAPFYAHRQLLQAPDKTTLESQLNKLNDAYIITKFENQKYFHDLPGAHILVSKGYVMLVSWSNPQAQGVSAKDSP